MSRKRVFGLTLVLVVAALTVFAVFAGPLRAFLPHANAVQYVDEDKIFDENGREVIWRGAGGSYLFHTEGDDYKTAWKTHMAQIQGMGLNTLRLAFAFADSAPNPETGKPSADILDFEKLDWILDFLDKHNMKAILDLHNCLDMYGDFGSQKLVDDWVVVAQRYRGDSRIVAYELFNEPYWGTWGPSVKTKWDVLRAYTNLTREIREVDSGHIHIWQSEGCYLPPLEEVIGEFEPNIVLTAHRWWTHRLQEFEIWTPEQLSYMVLGYLAEIKTKFNVPFWLGEFGAHYPFNSSNPEFLLTQQLLFRCEEQVIGWNLWMGRTAMDRPWHQYLDFFPLDVYDANVTGQPWESPSPKLTDCVIEQRGAESLEFYRMEMWHNNDYVIITPKITILVITNHKLPDGSYEVVSEEEIEVINQITVRNEEGTTTHPGDWNVIIYVLPLT
jgi:hypothetical protein